jgi:hypothetical protein
MMHDPFASPLDFFPSPPRRVVTTKGGQRIPDFAIGSITLIRPSDSMRFQEGLGIPSGRQIVAVAQLYPLDWLGYVFDLIGTYEVADDPPTAPRFWLDIPPRQRKRAAPRKKPPYTVFDYRDYTEGSNVLIAWCRRVAYEKARAWLEVRWHPVHGETVAVHHEASTLPLADAEEAFKRLVMGQALLRKMTGPGRRPGSGVYATREAFLTDVRPIIQKLLGQGKKPSRNNIAVLYPSKTSERQLYAWAKSFGMTWLDVCHACSTG